jgi:PAS domain S-box-containing protein
MRTPDSGSADAFAGVADEQFRRFVDSVSDYAIFMLSPTGIVTTWNVGAERLKGHRSDEIVGRHFSAFHPSEAIQLGLPDKAIQTAAREGKFEDEGWRLRKDGGRFWANVVISRVNDGAGELLGFTKVTRDLTERRQAQEQLEEKNRLLETILECVGDGITVCNREGTFVYRNQAALALTGPSSRPDEGLTGSVERYGIFREDGVTPMPMSESTMMKALRGEPSDNVAAVIRNSTVPQGVHLDITTRPLRDGHGAVVGAVVTTHDVSARKRAEQELGQQHALLRSVLDCVVDSVAVFDANRNLILANQAFVSLVGTKFDGSASVEERFVHYGLFDSTGDRRLDNAEAPAERAMRGEQVEDLELLIRSATHPNGRIVSTNARSLTDPQGQVIGAVVTGRDVTQRRQAERQMEEQAKLLATILDCTAEGVVVYDPDGRILLANRAAERLLNGDGRSTTLRERTAGISLTTLDGEPLSIEDSPAARALKGEAVDDLEMLVRSPRALDIMPLSSSGRPLRDENGRQLGAVITFRDITARKRAEAEKEALLTELHRSNADLAQFAHVASHDLRSPLRAIDGLAKWLENDLRSHFSAENAEQMQLLRRRVNRMDRLLRDLLDYAQVGRERVEAGEVDTKRLIDEIVELAALPSSFAVQVRIGVARLKTAAVPLQRVLLNIVTNAVKHHDRPIGTIDIAIRDAGEFVVFTVTDDGPGIPERFHSRVFQMFQSLRSRDEAEGSGMGLAFVKKLIEQVGGSVELASEGRGATFVVNWPKTWTA